MSEGTVHFVDSMGMLHAIADFSISTATSTRWSETTCEICLTQKPQPAEPTPVSEYSGACICNTGPSTDGPEETCPQHGRPYAYWVDQVGVLEMRLVLAADRSNTLGSEIAEIKGSLSQVAVYEGMDGSPTALLVSELVRDHEELEARIDAALLVVSSLMNPRSPHRPTRDDIQQIASLLRGGKRVPDDTSELEGS